MKIFVSHAATDAQLARGLVGLLQLGAGVRHGDIFCSSIDGAIPNGVYFVQHILRELMAADLIVALLSPSYFQSQFCLAEAGVAQARQIDGTATSYSLLVPPADFGDLEGVLYGVQSGRILDAGALDGVRDRVTRDAVGAPSTAVWNRHARTFQRSIIRWQRGLRQLTVQDVYPDRSTNPRVVYKLKLRIVLRNDSGRALGLRAPTWIAEAGHVPFQAPPCSRLQVEAPGGWETGHWQGEATDVHVPAGRAIRVWIGLDQSFTDDDIIVASPVVAAVARGSAEVIGVRRGSQGAPTPIGFGNRRNIP